MSFGDSVTAFRSDADGAVLTIREENGAEKEVRARFCLDGSGFGRILPRLLNLEQASTFHLDAGGAESNVASHLAALGTRGIDLGWMIFIHDFFQDEGFLYVNTPIITASDAEGAGAMFQVTTLDPAAMPSEIMLSWKADNWEHRAFWGEDAIPFGAGSGENHRPMGALPAAGEWVRLEVPARVLGLTANASLTTLQVQVHGGQVDVAIGIVPAMVGSGRPEQPDARRRGTADRAVPDARL